MDLSCEVYLKSSFWSGGNGSGVSSFQKCSRDPLDSTVPREGIGYLCSTPQEQQIGEGALQLQVVSKYGCFGSHFYSKGL